MKDFIWTEEFPSAITICKQDGTIIYMNEKSKLTFKKDGGEKLIGTNALDCHPEPSRTKLKKMLQEGKSNNYTIEKNGIKKLIHQSPWYEKGAYMGFVEISIEVDVNVPHFKRG
jgi:transcriptional regulator with PAS, ATPase and Fis domain